MDKFEASKDSELLSKQYAAKLTYAILSDVVLYNDPEMRFGLYCGLLVNYIAQLESRIEKLESKQAVEEPWWLNNLGI